MQLLYHSGVRVANVREHRENKRTHKFIFSPTQMFTWRIGQAQTFEGAKVTSTNTDGLFTVMEPTQNNKILEREAASINVEIEPEPTYLISKDTNNRIEMNPNTGEVQAASGGTLGCRSWAGKKGPSPSKNLAHPAIIDWALCEYLIFAAMDTTGRASLDKPFNPEVGLNILLSAQHKMDKVRLLNMFQNVIASSVGSIRYNFALKHGQPDSPIILQHYNRVFIMKDHTPNTVHLAAAVARKITPVQLKNRKKNHEYLQQHDDMASDVLRANGIVIEKLPPENEASITKLTNIESTWFMYIDNRALKYIPDDEVDFILNNLDYGKYLVLLGDGFEKSWRNILPHAAPKTNMVPFGQDLDAAMAAYKAGKDPQAAVDGSQSPQDAPKQVNVITPADPPKNAPEAVPAPDSAAPDADAPDKASPEAEAPAADADVPDVKAADPDAPMFAEPAEPTMPYQAPDGPVSPGDDLPWGQTGPVEDAVAVPAKPTDNSEAGDEPDKPDEPVFAEPAEPETLPNGQTVLTGYEPEEQEPNTSDEIIRSMLDNLQVTANAIQQIVTSNPNLSKYQDALDQIMTAINSLEF